MVLQDLLLLSPNHFTIFDDVLLVNEFVDESGLEVNASFKMLNSCLVAFEDVEG